MNLTLKPCKQEEVLAYLGYQNQTLDPLTIQNLQEMEALLLQSVSPKAVFNHFSLFPQAEGQRLGDTDFLLLGKDIQTHLEKSSSCVLLAATLGVQVDTQLRRLQSFDMAKALIFDALATVAIEQICDQVCDILSKDAQKTKHMLTSRFSPGYGDMPLSQQKDFCTLLDSQRKIGLSHTASFLLTPQKSVTAVVGLTNEKTSPIDPCSTCKIFDTCTLRKAGKTCGLPK